ncbi:LLM class flavin-dependent oxidoreductase [soil metagenome]
MPPERPASPESVSLPPLLPLPPLSVLEVAPVGAGGTAREALEQGVMLAQLAEAEGYHRIWVAEHHGMPSIASSSPEILIHHLAGRTSRIRVGAGGIMLPNHAPLRIAEAFHTLEALHPDRIDLGLGRAPGTDPATSRALRPFDAEQFPDQVRELLALSEGGFPEGHPFAGVRVIPEGVRLPPVWILGSSGASAQLAGSLGLGYAFASHFSPTPPEPALDAYRESFRAAGRQPAAHVILGVSVVCAETDADADRLATSMDLGWVRLRRGQFTPLPTPEEAAAHPWTPAERALVRQYRDLTVVGDSASVRQQLGALSRKTGADELMVMTMVHDPEARRHSYRLLAGVR